MNQVSSRGCSRAYILCVLRRAVQYVRTLRSQSQPVTFPFSCSEIDSWLLQAQQDCSNLAFQRIFGGTDFNPNDPSTFWTNSSHFFTWWKNNVERKTKFLSLVKDSDYGGEDERGTTRQAIALAVNIKNHFERVLNQQMDRTVVTQIRLPFRMLDSVQHGMEGACACLAGLDDMPASKSFQSCGECSCKATFIDFEEYLRTIRGNTKNAKRRSTASTAGTRKRARVENQSSSDAKKAKACDDDSYDAYEPMRRMYEAVELQRSERPVRATRSTLASVATSPLDSSAACDYESDSALLLGMKKDCRVRTTSQETVDPIQQVQEEHGNTGYESGSSSDQSTHSAYFAAAFGASSQHNVDDRSYVVAFPASMPSHQAYTQIPLHIATSPFRGGDLTSGAYLLTRCASPDTNLDYSYPAPELSETGVHYAGGGGEDFSMVNAVAGASPGDGAALRDFLAACYRDGMYPSPVAQGAGRDFSVAESSGSSGRRSPTPSMMELPGQEQDTTTAYHSFGYAEKTAWPPDAETLPYSSDAGKVAVLDHIVGQQGDSICVGPAHTRTTSSSSSTSSQSGNSGNSADGTATFAYEELQQLLTHLLHENSSVKD